MMCVMIVETTQQDLNLIRFIVSIGIHIDFEVGALGHIYSLGCDFKTYGQMKMICENRFFISLSITVGILQYNDLVVRLSVSGL